MPNGWDTSDMEAGILDLQQKIERGAARGLAIAAEELKGRASALAPLDEGTLAASGRTAVDEATLTAYVGFGNGAASAYALVQHERLDFRHAHGQAKYLEQPTSEFGDDLIKIVGKAVEGAI